MNGLNAILLFTVLTAVASFPSEVELLQADLPTTVKLFNGDRCTGQGFDLPNRAPDLGEFGWNETSPEVASQQYGISIFYEFENFEGRGTLDGWILLYILASNPNPTPGCHTLTGSINAFRSMRIVGDPKDYYASTITFYENLGLQRNDQLTYGDTPSLNFLATGFVSTGSEDWTVYSLPNYEGYSQCISAENPTIIWDIYEQLGFQRVTFIQSARKGCHSKNIAKIPKATARNVIKV